MDVLQNSFVKSDQGSNSERSNKIYEAKRVLNAQKLHCGLKTIFEGVSMIFDSLGTDCELSEILKSFEVAEVSSNEASSDDSEHVKEIQNIQTHSEAAVPTISKKPKEFKESKGQKESRATEESKPSVTLDDITKLVLKKIKQEPANNSRIEELVCGHGVSKISELPEATYETFMAELASL